MMMRMRLLRTGHWNVVKTGQRRLGRGGSRVVMVTMTTVAVVMVVMSRVC